MNNDATIEDLRNAIKKKMEEKSLSLRDIEAKTAISFSTVSRFLRGQNPSYSTFDALSAWVIGAKYKREVKKVSSRAIVVNGKRFIVTIEAV